MVTKTTTTHTCDACNVEINSTCLARKIQVIFHTDQTEGQRIPSYLSEEKVDLCNNCYAYILQGNYLHGEGAQGCNKFYFKGEVK